MCALAVHTCTCTHVHAHTCACTHARTHCVAHARARAHACVCRAYRQRVGDLGVEVDAHALVALVAALDVVRGQLRGWLQLLVKLLPLPCRVKERGFKHAAVAAARALSDQPGMSPVAPACQPCRPCQQGHSSSLEAQQGATSARGCICASARLNAVQLSPLELTGLGLAALDVAGDGRDGGLSRLEHRASAMGAADGHRDKRAERVEIVQASGDQRSSPILLSKSPLPGGLTEASLRPPGRAGCIAWHPRILLSLGTLTLSIALGPAPPLHHGMADALSTTACSWMAHTGG